MSRIIRIDSLHSGDRHTCIANGDGMRVIIWWCGCDIHCEGCHNEQYWDFDNNEFEEFSQKHIDIVINEISNNKKIYNGISILGGEPFSRNNINDVLSLCKEFKKEFPEKDIWIWSGHTKDWLDKQTGEYGDMIQELFSICHYLVDGPFILSKRNISLKFRGSDNQRIINLTE